MLQMCDYSPGTSSARGSSYRGAIIQLRHPPGCSPASEFYFEVTGLFLGSTTR